MDNGYIKIHTTNQKPSDKQIAVFRQYARQGINNEMIALITGWRKPTVDKYVKENSYVTDAWNKIKEYANHQISASVNSMNNEEENEINLQIAMLRKKADELEEQKKAMHVAPFNWVVKYEQPKPVAKTESAPKICKRDNREMHHAVKSILINIFADKQIHTKEEVNKILEDNGYKVYPTTATQTLKYVFGANITIKHGQYVLAT